MNEGINIAEIYFELLNHLQPSEDDLDYSTVDSYLDPLQRLSTVCNSGISVFDLYKKQHLFYSSNYGELLGYHLEDIQQQGQEFLDDKIHPEDKLGLFKNGISSLKLFSRFSKEEKLNHKLLSEYRILNAENKYVRLIEQHQVLALDKEANLWLSVSFVDISPNQEEYEGVKSQLLNFRTGKILSFIESKKPQIELTKREVEILKLVKDGFLSKEISDRLSISVHTVNTHRQRFLEKLEANNSIEAVTFASKMGLLG
jgi:DNA-binding CsgD family transcriptional regulator